ncbi:MAG: hypothetical protein ACYC2O_10330 [Microthrixaceae bacterium]
MPALRTEITEIVTGLAMLGHETLDDALSGGCPEALHHVDDPAWQRLRDARHRRDHDHDFLAAWNNGRAFLLAADGLRCRPPRVVEWTGGRRDPGDGAVPADLRIDHVYLVSCKYLSKVLHNASPWALFDRCLSGAPVGRSDADWFDAVAPAEHQELYQHVRRAAGADLDLPEAVTNLTKSQRRDLRTRIPKDWGDDAARAAYRRLTVAAAQRSAARWTERLDGDRAASTMLWRLLRLSAAPYFVLGTGATSSLRLRVGTPWDFSQAYRVRSLELDVPDAGQATVTWCATVRSTAAAGDDQEVRGHVEVRWTHGRFGGPPEAKVYLDTPHTRVPGYWPLV